MSCPREETKKESNLTGVPGSSDTMSIDLLMHKLGRGHSFNVTDAFIIVRVEAPEFE